MGGARGIVAFDLDGTLVRGTTTALHLAEWVGQTDMAELERLYDEGKMTNVEVAEKSGPFFEGRTRTQVREALADIPLIDGIQDTTRWLQDNGLIPVIATVTWQIAAELLADEHGFAAASGCAIAENDNGCFTGVIARHFEADEKVSFVAEIAQGHGLSVEDAVAVGDAASDIPLFKKVALSIALNATVEARTVAHVHLDTDDLRDVIPIIERHYARG